MPVWSQGQGKINNVEVEEKTRVDKITRDERTLAPISITPKHLKLKLLSKAEVVVRITKSFSSESTVRRTSYLSSIVAML